MALIIQAHKKVSKEMKIKKQPMLWVMAVPQACVREIDEQGRPLMGGAVRMIGKIWDPEIENYVIDPGGATVAYHSYYISRLKEGALIPTDKQTAILAGVKFESFSI